MNIFNRIFLFLICAFSFSLNMCSDEVLKLNTKPIVVEEKVPKNKRHVSMHRYERNQNKSNLNNNGKWNSVITDAKDGLIVGASIGGFLSLLSIGFVCLAIIF